MANKKTKRVIISVVSGVLGAAILVTGGVIASTAFSKKTAEKKLPSQVATEIATKAKETVSPTVTPTKPTEAPTTKPTEKPTVAPTEKPTVAPTEKPTVAPTQKPTEKKDPVTPTQGMTDCGISKKAAQKIAGFQFTLKEFANYSIKANSDTIIYNVKISDDENVVYTKCSDLSYGESYKTHKDAKNFRQYNFEGNAFDSALFNIKEKVHDVYFTDGTYAYSIHWDVPIEIDDALAAMGVVFALN